MLALPGPTRCQRIVLADGGNYIVSPQDASLTSGPECLVQITTHAARIDYTNATALVKRTSSLTFSRCGRKGKGG